MSEGEKLRRSRLARLLNVPTGALCLLLIFAIPSPGNQVPSAVSIQALNIGLTDDRQVRLMAGWNSALSSGDPSLAIAAINLLEFCPPQLRTRLLMQARDSQALLALFNSLNRNQRDQLVASLFRYPELVQPLVGALTKELLSLDPSRDNLQYLSDIVALLRNQTPIAPDFYRQVLKYEERSSEIQVRQTIQTLLVAHVAGLKDLNNELKPLLNSRNPDEKQFAVHVMLILNMNLPEQVVGTALADTEGLQPDAIRYLGSRSAALSSDELKVLIPILAQPRRSTAWAATYSTLQKKNPQLLDEFFTKYKTQYDALAKAPPSILVEILTTLPPQQDNEIATWPLINSKSDDCNVAIANLRLLERRSKVGGDFPSGLWTVLKGQQSCSGDEQTILDLINRVLGANSDSMERFAAFASSHIQDPSWDDFANGVAAYTGWENRYQDGGSGSERLQVALSPALLNLLHSGANVKALQLLRLGVPVTLDAAANAELLTQLHNQKSKLDESNVELLGRLVHPPKALKEDLSSIAQDSSREKTLRQAAILALSNVDTAQDNFDAFERIAQEPINLPSIAAVTALTKLYSTPEEHLPLPAIASPWLETAATDRFAQSDTSRLLEVLTAKNNAFAPLLLQSIPDPTSYRCWDLAVIDNLRPRLWLTILDAGLADSDRLAPARACVMILTEGQPAAGLISAALTGQRSQNTPQSGSDRSALLSGLTSVWDQTQGLNKVRGAIANQVDLLSSSLTYTVDSQRQLRQWSVRLQREFPEVSQRIKGQASKQTVVLFLLGIPLIVLIHLILWICLLFVYPYSPAIQSVVLWNRLVRKLLSLGYMDAILLAVPAVRRRLFLPLKEQMLGELLQPASAELDRRAYFSKGRVRHNVVAGNVSDNPTEEPIATALSRLETRTLLLGASGLGKSSFLRNSLSLNSSRSDCAIYIPAGRCTGGVEKAIAARVPLFSQDTDLLHSLIFAGRMEVYIDGYNEVDPSTQEEIAGFVAMSVHAKILVTSQIPIRGLSRLDTLELLPLRREEIQEFLISRETILPPDFLLSGEAFRTVSAAYLKNLWTGSRPESETKALEQVLSNPMDLTTTALILGNGKEPSLLSLQEQQFAMLQANHLHKYGRQFRTELFSENVFQLRVNNDDDLDKSTYDREVASLIDDKMAITRAVEVPGKAPTQEILFRHDRIRDYFTHFAFLDSDKDERRLQHASDSRFAGVYEYLAKTLDLGAAERLREQLIMSAVENQDHRLSDSFIKQLSWRRQFAATDPTWLGGYDVPEARDADLRFDSLQLERSKIEKDMLRLKETMSRLRNLARILSTSDESAFSAAVVSCLERIGGSTTTSNPAADAYGLSNIKSPHGLNFTVATLSSRTAIDSFQVELVRQRLKQAGRPVLLVTNSNVSTDPRQRDADLSEKEVSSFLQQGIVCCSAVDIYQAYRNHVEGKDTSFWSIQEDLWREASTATSEA
jgi:hypothetical protein